MQEYMGKKVLIFGLGLNDGGLGMTEYFLRKGAKVTITDGKTEEELKPTLQKLGKDLNNVTLHLGGHLEEDFLENDIIIRNPAIKPNNEYLKIARENGKQIEMEMSFFHKNSPCPIIGITGTRGKSTTTTLIYEFLSKKFGKRIFLGGNIGKSAVRELDVLNKDNIAVLELSSFQLDAMGENKISPHIAVLTNIYTDHQDWHGSMEEYIKAKKNIFLYQNDNDYLVLNVDNGITEGFRDISRSKVITYSTIDSKANYYIDNDHNVYENGSILLNIKDSKLEGKHNEYNILAAIATSRIYDITVEDISDVLRNFNGVKGRQELIRELNGIRFYNDTTATSVEAMIAMFERFGEKNKRKMIMIAGGVDKGLDYSRITGYVRDYLKSLILLEGTASEKIYESVNDLDNIYKYYDDLGKAVEKAYEIAIPGDMIILCPGGASFNMFTNEFDRGEKFVNYVNLLK